MVWSVKGAIGIRRPSYELKISDCRKYSIGVELEDEELETNLASLEKVREALALLAAVAHVDRTVAKGLLDKCCEVKPELNDESVKNNTLHVDVSELFHTSLNHEIHWETLTLLRKLLLLTSSWTQTERESTSKFLFRGISWMDPMEDH
ncbi:hypothetical protein JG688_00010473 [Phytophthora aleatoria]|uniref:Uncharacterized protein n=1 Tax=Phytophthora aleatoria TaxID=2496075 RepID=A0A8J5J5M1_9STRA|nr:hypothetical protein JG688_00010473 [Phytophthora aleatoria]